MEKRELINVCIGITEKDFFVASFSREKIPKDIDEVELKAQLRDLGYISSNRLCYLHTRVFLIDENKNNIEICTSDYRTLDEIGVKENSRIVVKPEMEEPLRRVIYRDPSDIQCLYGCPMARSVKDAINDAERYVDSDSIIETIHIKK